MSTQPNIFSQFQNGGQNVTTQGMDFGQGGLAGIQSNALQGMGGFGDTFNKLFQYRAGLAAQDRATKAQQYQDQLKMAQESQRMQQQQALMESKKYADAMDQYKQQQNDPLAYAQKRAAIIAADESTRPAPMKMVSGMNIIGGYTTDPNAMDATQRKLFLPNDSKQQSTPWDTESNIGALQNQNLGPWELGGNRQAFASGAPTKGAQPRADNNLMQGARDAAQSAGYQGANNAGYGGGYAGARDRTDWNGVYIPDISAGIGAYGQRPMDRTASFNQYASGAPGQSPGAKKKPAPSDEED